jgi:hypothetical protein
VLILRQVDGRVQVVEHGLPLPAPETAVLSL